MKVKIVYITAIGAVIKLSANAEILLGHLSLIVVMIINKKIKITTP